MDTLVRRCMLLQTILLGTCFVSIIQVNTVPTLGVTPQKYRRIFIIIFIIYFGYKLSQTWVFPGKLINC